MFNPLKGLGEKKEMIQQALAMQKALAAEEVTVEENGITIIMSGDQTIKEVSVDGQRDERMKNVMQKAIRKSQEIAARKLQSMGGMGGMFGQQ